MTKTSPQTERRHIVIDSIMKVVFEISEEKRTMQSCCQDNLVTIGEKIN